MFVPCCLSHFEVQSSPEPVSCDSKVEVQCLHAACYCCMLDCSAPSVVIMMHAPTIPGAAAGKLSRCCSSMQGLQHCSREHAHLWVSVGLIRMRTRVDEAVLLQIIIR